MIVTLAGGVGAARFLEGLIRVIPQKHITIIGNVGDDTEFYGLHISPDLDIVAYTLAGLVDRRKGWGFRAETFHCQKMLQAYGYVPWFNLGDRDLATHLYRTEELTRGNKLSTITARIVSHLGLQVSLFPATDDLLQTHVISGSRRMHFQEYMVRLRTKPKVNRVYFKGVGSAKPLQKVIQSIRNAEGIIICPSNPIVSIGAVLAVRGVRSELRKTRARVVGISPIVGGKTIKGPADKMMKALGVEPTAFGVAKYYRDFLDTLIIDTVDRKLAPRIESLGIKAVVVPTLMKTMGDKVRLARVAMSELSN